MPCILHEFLTDDADSNVRNMAIELQDTSSRWTFCKISQQKRPSPKSWGWNWDDVQKHGHQQDNSSSSQPNLLELVKCSCRSINGCSTRCDFKKPIGHALNFARATVSNELIFASLLLNFYKSNCTKS